MNEATNVGMQSDIMLTKGEKTLIIDAKYYTHTTQIQFGIQTLHSANLYQIFTYVKNQAAKMGEKGGNVSGLLLYAETDEKIELDYDYKMSGNKIGVKTLDLSEDFSKIASQLKQTANDYLN